LMGEGRWEQRGKKREESIFPIAINLDAFHMAGGGCVSPVEVQAALDQLDEKKEMRKASTRRGQLTAESSSELPAG